MLGTAVGMLGFVLTSPALVRAQSSYVPPDVKTNDDGPGKPEWSGAFIPPDPIPGGWDWVRMSSGEWIKGEIVLTSAIDLDLIFVWDRLEEPEKDSNQETPDSDDFRISAGLAVEF